MEQKKITYKDWPTKNLLYRYIFGYPPEDKELTEIQQILRKRNINVEDIFSKIQNLVDKIAQRAERKEKMTKKWLGKAEKCDLCQQPLTSWFVDGKTQWGPWALMCPECFRAYGIGLGLGRGQKYLAKTKEKIEG